MSAPDTKLQEQEKRHRAPLLGMRGVVVFALVLLALLAILVFARGDEPGEEGVGVDGTPPGAAIEQTGD